MSRRLVAAAALLAVSAGAAVRASAPDGAEPGGPEVLSRRCLSCHSAEKRTGGLDLTTRAAAARVLVPAGASRLLRAVETGRMPPAGKLPAGEIAALRRWIAAGAAYPAARLEPVRIADQPLWSLEPVRRPPVPHSRFDALSANPIDRFLFQKLEENGLQPSPPADPRALIRRVTLDLTGLPPTPEEVDAFLRDCAAESLPAEHAEARGKGQGKGRGANAAASADPSGSPPGQSAQSAQSADASQSLPPSAPFRVFRGQIPEAAYRRLVERLLASPAYGERWGRHWLDVVRFGESNGYEQNHLRSNAWPYRDYVIRALNEDKPYDRFVMEQLAGDVLGQGDPNVEAATGFLVAGVHDTVGNQTEEGTRVQRANDLDDMVATVGETFLGLTVGCAKCHDHKFDPVPQRDYYRLAAVFAGVRHGERPLEPPSRSGPREDVDAPARQVRRIAGEIADLDAAARVAVLRAQAVEPVPRPAVSPVRNVDDFSPVEARFVRFTVLATRDGAQPCLDELEVYGPDGDANLAASPTGAKASASSELPGFAIHQVAHLNDGRYGNERSWISNEPGGGWAQVELPAVRRVSRVIWSRDAGEPARFTDRLANRYRIEVSLDGQAWQTVATGDDRASAPESIPAETLRQALTPEQRERRRDLTARLETARRQAASAGPQKVYAGMFGAPEPVYLLARGDVMRRLEEVTPAALSRVPGCPGELFPAGAPMPEAERRLALARWITHPKNPLTSRVIVNRVWHYHFGQGLVPTPSDFGHNGSVPSHAELLDYLAYWFTQPGSSGGNDGEKERGRDRAPGLTRTATSRGDDREKERGGDRGTDGSRGRSISPSLIPSIVKGYEGLGWSLKRLHRLIVTSYAYRQSSNPNPSQSAQSVQSVKSVVGSSNPQSRVPSGRRNPQSRDPQSRDPQSIDAGNRLLWRMPLRRMEGEAIRDAILAVSGKLDRTMGGPGYRLYKYRVVNVAIYEPAEEYGPETWRRSVYRQVARAIREELLGTYDCPESAQRSPRRASTTTPLQALSLLNGPFMAQQSGFFAERVQREAGPDPSAQVAAAFRLAFGRAPSTPEQTAARELVRKHGLSTLCRALFNANEFLYY